MSPIRVDFYLLAGSEPKARLLYACQLLEKAYQRGHSVFVYCKNQNEALDLDELLWTFKEDSFIAHNLQGEGLTPPPPIQIGCQASTNDFKDILLNLSDEVPAFSSQFCRILELVPNDEEMKALSRLRFQEYRARQYALYTHNIGSVPASPKPHRVETSSRT